MAIYHLTTKPIKRSSGRSATASSAYRTASKMKDERTGVVHDYTKKQGVVATKCFALDDNKNHVLLKNETLWNTAEKAEKRKDSRTAREIIVALPCELDKETREQLTDELATQLADKYSCAIEYAIHEPDTQGDNRNHHAHIMMTTRSYDIATGNLGDKTDLELSNTKSRKLGKKISQEQIKDIRKAWAVLANTKLEQANTKQRIDHRSHKERGLQELPSVKMGYVATEMERNGKRTERGNINRIIKEHNSVIQQYRQLVLNEVQQSKNPVKRVDISKQFILKDELIKQSELQPSKPTMPRAEKIASIDRKLKRAKADPRDVLTEYDKRKDREFVKKLSSTSDRAEHKAMLTERLHYLNERTERYKPIMKKYADLQHKVAESLRRVDLKAIKERALPLFDKIKEHKKKEPIIIGRKPWKEWLDKATTAYSKIEKQFYRIKDMSIKDYVAENRDRVKVETAKQYPEEYKEAGKAVRMFQIDSDDMEQSHKKLQAIEQAERQEKQQERQAKREQERQDKPEGLSR